MDHRDYTIIQEQIGRVPEGLQDVVARDKDNLPAVVRVASLVRSAPFPTFLWLTHPGLTLFVNRLESTGVIKQWEREAKENPDFAKAIFDAHELYSKRRDSFLAPSERKFLEELFKEEKSFKKLGVGGVFDWTTIRCLHMHLADFLTYGDNEVGRKVFHLIPKGVY